MGWNEALANLNTAVHSAFRHVTIQRQGKLPIEAVFDYKSLTDDTIGNMPGEAGKSFFSGQFPFLTLTDAQADGMTQGEEILVDEVQYRVRDMLPDGMGYTFVKLKKVP